MIAVALGSGHLHVSLSTQAVFDTILAFCTLVITTATYVLIHVTSLANRRITYGVPVSAGLIDQSAIQSSRRPDLHIWWRYEVIADPYVLEVALNYRGRRVIKSDDFDKGRPFCIDVGVPIIELLEKVFDPEEAPSPSVEVSGTALRIGPDLLRKRQAMTFVILTDGPCGRLSHENPLDAKVKAQPVTRYQPRDDTGLWRRDLRGKTIRWAIVLFIVFYIATQPSGAASFVHHFYNGLHDVANSMAKFINSL
jgi:hypothetical protein